MRSLTLTFAAGLECSGKPVWQHACYALLLLLVKSFVANHNAIIKARSAVMGRPIKPITEPPCLPRIAARAKITK